MQNVEFKAEIRDIDAARRACAERGARSAGACAQVDTYVRVPAGRLKRRETPGRAAEWILYHRPDTAADRLSRYTILSDEQARVRFGQGTLTPWKVVRKVRELWLLGNVRIHFDAVEGLGSYLEIEAVVTPRHDVAECRAQVAALRAALALALGDAIAGSYESMSAEVAEAERLRRLP